jgi:hypothetical protein
MDQPYPVRKATKLVDLVCIDYPLRSTFTCRAVIGSIWSLRLDKEANDIDALRDQSE